MVAYRQNNMEISEAAVAVEIRRDIGDINSEI